MELNNKKILIVDCRRIGDSLMSTPIAQAIKTKYPKAKIGFILEKLADGITKNSNFIDKTHIFNSKGSIKEHIKLFLELKKERYDIAIDSLGMPKTALIAFLSGAKVRVGIHKKRSIFYTKLYEGNFNNSYSAHHKLHVLHTLDAFPKTLPLPHLQITQDETELMRSKILSYFLKPKMFFTSSPATKIKENLWSVKNWADFYDNLIDKYNFPIVILFAPNEEKYIHEIYLLMKNKQKAIVDIKFANIRELTTFLSFSKLHITQDNGSKHLANTQKTPVVALYAKDGSPKNWSIPRGFGVIDEYVFQNDSDKNMYELFEIVNRVIDDL